MVTRIEAASALEEIRNLYPEIESLPGYKTVRGYIDQNVLYDRLGRPYILVRERPSGNVGLISVGVPVPAGWEITEPGASWD